MALINGSIPSLTQGVSQQPPSLRLPTQCDEQINAISSLQDGLSKRPPTQHVAKLTSSGYVKSHVHWVNRDEVEQYLMIFSPEAITIADKDGHQYPVVDVDNIGFSYLSTRQPYRYIKALTISDTTFVLNRSIATKLKNTTLATRSPEALVWIRAGTYKCDYTLKISSTSYTYQTDATDNNTLRTTQIADNLATGFAAALGAPWEVERFANSIWIYPDSGGAFSITSSDDNGDKNHVLIKDEVASFDMLPENAPNGYIVKVKGNIENASDDYWVKFETRGNTAFGPGLWVEAGAPGAKYIIDETLMPHQLVRKEDTDGTATGLIGQIYFEWNVVRWAYRQCGGDELPAPSFLGYPISDIFLHRNRMGFLAQGMVVLSQASNVYNFWRQTGLTLLDSDPIDVTVAHQRAINLRHAISFNDELLLFADRTQFTLKGGDILSPKTVSVTATTDYASHIDCSPLNAENMVFFPFDNGSYSGLREYYIDQQSQAKDAKTVTDHCPRYIKGSALKMAVSPTTDMLLVQTDTERNFIYIYQWFWNGQDKVQSAWHKWDFGDYTTVVAAGYLGDVLYLVNIYNDGTYLEKVDMAPSAADTNQEYSTMLDRRVVEDSPGVIASYVSSADHTVITLPYITDGGQYWTVVTRGTTEPDWVAGRAVTVKEISGNKITVEGDVRTGFYAGRTYTMEYTFSTPYLRSQSQFGGVNTVQEGRLQILDWIVNHTRTGYYRGEVECKYRDTALYPMTGQIILNPVYGTGLGDPQLRDGTHRFRVMSKNDEAIVRLVNDSHMPSHFASAEWVAEYSSRARRV